MPYAPQYQPGQFNSPRAAGNVVRAPREPGLGDAIAEGLGKTGNALMDYAKAEDAIQAHYDQTQARRLAVEYQTEVSAIMSEFQGQRGENAINAAPQVRQRLEELRASYAGQANNPRMQEALAERLDPLSLRAYETMVTHAQREQITLDEQVTVAERNMAIENAVASYLDPGAANEYRAQALDALNHQATLMGWSEEIVASQRLAITSQIHKGTLQALMSETNPDWTFIAAYFGANEDEMNAADRTSMGNAIQGPLQRREAVAGFMEIASSSSPVGTGDAGGGPATAPGTRSAPVDGEPSSGFGMRRHPIDGEMKMHNGIDWPAPAGSSIRAAGAGTVAEVGSNPQSPNGYYIKVRHPDDTTSIYLHMAHAPTLRVGDPVTAQSVIGTVGSTGRSTGPHLHFSVTNAAGEYIDPEEWLSGTNPIGAPSDPRNWDHASVMAGIDAKVASGQWNFEFGERVRDEAMRRMQSDEALLRDREADAAREASRWILDNPDFTDPHMMPEGILNSLGVEDLSRVIATARDNASGASVAANGDLSIELRELALTSPAEFVQLDLGLVANQMTRAELRTFRLEQERAADRLAGWTPNTKINSTFNRMGAEDGINKDADASLRVREIMRDYLYNWFDRNGGSEPGDAIYEDAYRHATAEVETTMRRRIFGQPAGPAYQEQRPRYRNREADAAAQRNEARDILRSEGVLFPTEAQIESTIERMSRD